MTTMRESLAELGWSEELIDAFTATSSFRVSAPTINLSQSPSIRDHANLVINSSAPMLISGNGLIADKA